MADRAGEAYERYAKLIEDLLPPGGPTFEPVAEDDSSVQVERGLVLPMALAGADAERIGHVMERLLRPGSERSRIVDAAGHARPAYPGLLVYAWRRGRGLVARDLPGREADERCPALLAWRHRLAASVVRTRVASQAGAIGGADTAAALIDCAWAALACGWGVDGAWVFQRILGGQLPSGAFLPTAASANPEPFWYHELVLLHAVAAYASLGGNAGDAVARSAAYHLNETQPDHATSEPWGLLAFIRNAKTHSLADQFLHNVRVQHPGGAQGVTAILLADVLDRLRELADRSG